jgi:hypothetical protein
MSNRLGGFIAGQNINVSIGTFTAVTSPTFTFGSTDGTPVVGQAVQFTTTGTLPTGLSLNTTYYVISTSTNTCQFSTTISGSAVTFTNSSGSGTHTAVTQRAFSPYAGAPDTVEYLVVAGGGAGGGGVGGGGGAGGLLTAAGFSVASGSALTVTVGAGGVRGATESTQGTNGGNSVFSSITATGGGAGGTAAGGLNGQNGGSGGGAGRDVTGGTGVSGQGFAGGSETGSTSVGGGGGGAGSVGQTVSSVNGGAGGVGLCSTITGARVFYAGGGGGCIYTESGFPGLGNSGGGNGNGTLASTALSGFPGTANTGGGGGGGSGNGGLGGSGGSGIVIIRYPQINSAPALVTGSPQVNYADGYQIYTFTSSGSIIF